VGGAERVRRGRQAAIGVGRGRSASALAVVWVRAPAARAPGALVGVAPAAARRRPARVHTTSTAAAVAVVKGKIVFIARPLEPTGSTAARGWWWHRGGLAGRAGAGHIKKRVCA
jgi:hypothetical protein